MGRPTRETTIQMDNMGEFFATYQTSPLPHLKELYLGTRYTCLLAYIFFLIDLDGPRIPCHVRLW